MTDTHKNCHNYVFKIDLSEFGMDSGRIVFSQEPGKGTTAVHIDFFPLRYRSYPLRRTRGAWVTGSLAMDTTASAVRRRSRH